MNFIVSLYIVKTDNLDLWSPPMVYSSEEELRQEWATIEGAPAIVEVRHVADYNILTGAISPVKED